MCRVLLVLVAIACVQHAAARPVKKTLNFNMFLLRPHEDVPERVLLTTDGVSRFGPLLEYLVQRFQGLMSVRLPQDPQDSKDKIEAISQASQIVPIADASENEVDAVPDSRTSGVIVRPSREKPGTFEVEINVVVDDGQPENKNNNKY